MSEEVDKDGILWKRIGSNLSKKRPLGRKKWNLVYVNLIGSTLHYYKDEEDSEPKGTIELKQLELYENDNEGSQSKKFCFSLKNDHLDYLFASEEEKDLEQWVAAIKACKFKNPCPPLKKEKRRSRASELAFRAKKNMAGKVATSGLGKKAIRSRAPEEITHLINDIKKVVERESKSSKKAAEIEENVYKIGVKAYFLLLDNKICWNDLLASDKPCRAALELLIKCHNHAKFVRSPNIPGLQAKFQEVHSFLAEAGTILTKLLAPHMKPRNVARISETIEYLGNPDRLLRVFMDETLNEPLQEMINSAEHYTQFHFYPEGADHIIESKSNDNTNANTKNSTDNNNNNRH